MHLLQWILLEVCPFDYDGNGDNGLVTLMMMMMMMMVAIVTELPGAA